MMKCNTGYLAPRLFLLGLYQEVKLCPDLQDILELDNRVILLITLLTVLKKFIDRGIKVPCSLISHFTPFVQITENNHFSFVGNHIEFVNPKIRILRFDPNDREFVFVSNLESIDKSMQSQLDVPKLSISEKVCHTCGLTASNETFENFHKNGHFSTGHLLNISGEPDKMSAFMYTILNITKNHFKFYCKHCSFGDDIRKGDSKRFIEHIIQHSEKYSTFDKVKSIRCAQRELLKDIKSNTFNFEVCVSCYRIFETPAHLILHEQLFHPVKRVHFCLICKKKYFGKVSVHVQTYHKEVQMCPFNCYAIANVLIHHIILFHRENLKVPLCLNHIELSEILRIRSMKCKKYSNITLTHKSKTCVMDRTFDRIVKNIITLDGLNSSQLKAYVNLEKNSLRTIRLLLQAKGNSAPLHDISKSWFKQFHVTHVVNLLNNASGYIFKNSVQQTSPLNIFRELKCKRKLHLYPNIEMLPLFEINQYDAILVGNNLLMQINSDPNIIRCMNLSVDRRQAWKIKSFSFETNEKHNFEEHILKQIVKLETGAVKMMFIESSITPFLEKIDPTDRVQFLKDNVDEIACNFLHMIVKMLRQYEHIVIVTVPHTLFSSSFVEESKIVREYNEKLKVAALKLDIGIVELHQYGINEIHYNSPKSRYFSSTVYQFCSIVDYSETLTSEGKRLFLNHIRDYIAEYVWTVNRVK